MDKNLLRNMDKALALESLNELKIDLINTEQMSIRAGLPMASNSRNTRY